MSFPLYIAKRYLFSKSGTNAINIITFIAMFGVVVGSMALFIVLSGFSGLRTFSDSLLKVSDPDLKITAVKGKTFEVSKAIKNVLAQNTNIASASKVIEERVSLQYSDKNQIAFLKGVDSTYVYTVPVDSSLSMGAWLDKKYTNTAVIGAGISYKLGLGAFGYSDELEIYVPKPGTRYTVNPAKAFRLERVKVVGVYYGSEEFQNKYVFTDIALARKLLNYSENIVSAIEIKLLDANNSALVRDILQEELGPTFEVKTKKELNALYYKVVNTENFISYLIFTLIIVIALFNVIGSIIMMIIDKKNNIRTLLNLGSTVKEIKQIFVYQGFMMVGLGLVLGMLLGVLLVFLQLKLQLFMITDGLPYPVELRWSNICIVVVTISLLGYFASKIASSRISLSFINK
ncbi:ABC transporter permease [Tenacibaculum sp. SG-28]|uniref:ABC transporter permease n=1 Tax=Tenacibaculum sp. SG-28 TaxID=754426 RepID=UPI000CF37914|nr:ABC transporter permease [Tenacibaculum sp. SG-28]PQJ21546.1 ABC transporter permease [Tenacibaculum sp. SG-28]